MVNNLDSWYISIYNMILNTIQKEKRLNFVQIMNSEKTPYTSPPTSKKWGVFSELFLEERYCKISRVHCILTDCGLVKSYFFSSLVEVVACCKPLYEPN